MIRSNMITGVTGGLASGDYIKLNNASSPNTCSGGSLTSDAYSTGSTSAVAIIGIQDYVSLTPSINLQAGAMVFNDSSDCTMVHPTTTSPADITNYSYLMISSNSNFSLQFA